MLQAFDELYSIAKKLRSETGCPWDRSRTITDLSTDFAEEAEEIKQAIKNEDHQNLKEEIGDTFFTMLLMAIIAEEKGFFTMKDVFSDLKEKLVTRHTWVFGDDKVSTPEEAIAKWQENKRKLTSQSKS